jgi:hypothetical protein
MMVFTVRAPGSEGAGGLGDQLGLAAQLGSRGLGGVLADRRWRVVAARAGRDDENEGE